MAMRLEVLLPARVFLELADVARIVAETAGGSYGLLPRRRDCAAALVPGLLMYAGSDGLEHWLAVGEGVLIKTGDEVVVAVRAAVVGSDLAAMRAQVLREAQAQRNEEREMRDVTDKLEAAFLRRMGGLRHD